MSSPKNPDLALTPARLGFRMPAEWERHDATWLTWPKNKITWPGKMIREVEGIYVEMMRGLLTGEKVHLIVPDKKTASRVHAVLSAKKAKTSNLVFHFTAAVDTWIRDYGPIFVLGKSQKAFTKWTFNAWGGKYADLAMDNGVVDRLDELKKWRRFDAGMVLEGGSIDMNGRGTCLTTEQCLLNKNRNPKLSRRDIEKKLEVWLGVKKTIWLKEGIEGDDTDGHVDDITRFTDARTIVTAVEPDRTDKNHEYLGENLAILKKEKDQDGKPFRIVELPMPGRVGIGRGDADADRLPASYANFYIGNSVILLPIYSHSNDLKAVKIIKSLFKTRKILPIECTPLVYGLGSIHCVSQQEPSKQ